MLQIQLPQSEKAKFGLLTLDNGTLACLGLRREVGVNTLTLCARNSIGLTSRCQC